MMARNITITFATLLFGIALSAVADAEDVRYTTHIRGIVEQRCLGCHSSAAAPEYDAFKAEKEKWLAAGQGMRLDSYSHLIFFTGWPDSGSLMRRLDDGTNREDKKPGNMYQHLGNTEEERQKNLKLFKEWVGNWTLKKWSHITKQEMNSIKVRY